MYGNERSGYIKVWENLDSPNDCQLLKNYPIEQGRPETCRTG